MDYSENYKKKTARDQIRVLWAGEIHPYTACVYTKSPSDELQCQNLAYVILQRELFLNIDDLIQSRDNINVLPQLGQKLASKNAS